MNIDPTNIPNAADRPAHWVATMRTTCLLSGDETNGAYSMFEIVIPPHDPGPPPHTHTLEDEMFYVLEGEHTVIIDGIETTYGPGSWVLAPRHVPHGFRNDTDAKTRVLVIASPAGLEHFFAAAGVPVDPAKRDEPYIPTEADIARLMETIPKYGMAVNI